MPNAVMHPTPQELSAFSLGKLADAASAAVAGHLENCPECRKALDSLPGDSFLSKVRAAKPGISSLPVRPARAGNAANVPANAATPSAPPKDLPPDLAHYGKYRFLRELGRGGMGVVYQAEQTVMGRKVAVKVINPRVLDHPNALPRFQAEVRAAAKLDHDNIVRAYDAEQVGSMHLLVMEYVEGTSLAELVKKKGPLSIPHACHYIRQAALGLQHAFEQGMVHRDIKPQNLMVNPRGQVKVLDFGLARMFSERKQGCGLTQTDAFMGTPEYVAPEQATDARSADTRADIYSLGCTLFFLLTGRPPFQEVSMVKMVLAQIEKEPPVLHEVRADVPAELSAVVARMLAKDPARRFQTPIEVEQALAAFVKPGTKRPVAGVSPPASGVSSPAMGTAIAADTSKIKAILCDAPGTTSAPAAPAEDAAASAFAGLAEAVVSARKAKPARMKWWIGGGVAVSLLLGWLSYWLAVVLLRVETANGTLIVEMNGADVEARIKHGKLILSGPDGKVRYTLSPNERSKKLEEGSYQIRVKGADGLVLDTPEFTLKKGGEVRVRVTLKATRVAKKEPPNLGPDRKEVPPRPSKELDALRRDQIAPEALAAAGGGDPKRAPASLVGVLGEGQPFHTDVVWGLAYSPDGRWLASGSADKTIMLRDAATNEVKRVLKGHSGAVSAVAFSKDSKTLISSSHDGSIKLWSVEKETEPKTLPSELGQILTMAASPDGRFVAAWGADHAIKLWKWGQWDKPLDLPALKGRVSSLTFSPDGVLLASSWDGCVRLYQTSDGKPTQTWPFDETNRMLAFHRDGKRLVSTGVVVKTWDVVSGKQLAQCGHETVDFNLMALHPDGDSVYACSGSGLIGHMLELTTLRVIQGSKQFREPHGICSAVFSPKGKFLALGTNDGGVHVWDFSRGEKQLPKKGHSHYIHTLSVSPDGQMILSGGDDNAVRRWDVARPRESKFMDKTQFLLHNVAYSPDGKKYVASSSFWDHTSDMGVVWDAVTATRLFVVSPTVKTYHVVFSPDGKSLAGCGLRGGDECVVLWDANTGKQLHRFPKLGACLDRPAFSRDGKRVAAATTDTKAVKVWDVASGEEVASWTDTKSMCAVAFSPDGRLLAAGHHDGAISLWDLAEKGRKKRSWEGHSARITRLQFRPDGKTLVSSSADGTIRLWSPEAARSREIIPLGPANRPLTFDLDPSGRYLFAAGHTPLIFILRLP